MPQRKSFFEQDTRAEDDAARQREVAALMTERRTIPQDIGIERIQPNPFQARRTFDNLEELAEVMRMHGFVSRLRVRPNPQQPGFFELVYGERRLRAAALAGLDAIPCEVADHTDDDLIDIGLIENIQRRDLDPVEEARAFQTLIQQRGYSIRTLAEKIGKDKSYVENRLAVLRAPADVQQMVAARPDSLRAAREIAKLPLPAQRAPLIDAVTAGRSTTQDVRAQVRTALSPSASDAAPAPPHAAHDPVQRTIADDQRTMQAILERWLALLTADDAEHARLRAALEQVLHQAQHLTDALDGH